MTQFKAAKKVINDYSSIKSGRDLVRYMLQNYAAIAIEIKAVDAIIDLRHKRKPKDSRSVLRKCWTIVASEIKYNNQTDEELRYLADTAKKYLNILDMAISNLSNSRDINLLKDYYYKRMTNQQLSLKYKLDPTSIEMRRTLAIKQLGDMFELGSCVDLVNLFEHIDYANDEDDNVE